MNEKLFFFITILLLAIFLFSFINWFDELHNLINVNHVH